MTTHQWQPGDCFVFLSELHEDGVAASYGQVLSDLGGGRYRVITFRGPHDKGTIGECDGEALTLPITEAQMARARRLEWPQAAFWVCQLLGLRPSTGEGA